MSDEQNAAFNDEEENLCVVCYKDVDIFSFGVCDHPVCFECSTRMRVLCEQTECPICRQDMPKVIFTKTVQPYSKIIRQFENTSLQDRKIGLIFCTSDIQKSYWKLLEHRCSICDVAREEKKTFPFKNFDQLKEHMRREHTLFYCELCVENLNIFTFERKCYNRQQLALHRRKGDPDNTSHRGHPLCEFCETRFMDNDDLFRHMRRTHMFCHFCDADGRHSYYSNLNELKHHFRQDHFFCEEGECAETPLTAVFRTDIDLMGHVAREHSRHLGKAAGKQARTLDIEFTLAPRPRPRGGGGQNSTNLEPGEVTPEVVQVNRLGVENFPPLAGPNKAPNRPLTKVNFTSVVKRHGGSYANNNAVDGGPSREQFPALGGASSSTGSSTVRLSMKTPPPSQVSIQVKHKPNGGITTSIRTSAVASAPTTTRQTEAFPALGKSTKVSSQPQWVQQKPPKKQQEPKPKKVAAAPQLPPSDLQQFPPLASQASASNGTKSRKTTSVHVPVTQSWNNSNTSEKKSNSKNKKKETLNSNNNMAELNNNTTNQVKMRSELKIGTLSTPNNTRTPPGFSNANFPALGSNNMTFTNSTGQSYAIISTCEYKQPPNFAKRNRKLISDCQAILSGDSIMQFKKDSEMFRRDEINAKRYYDRCKAILGQNFEILFPELLVLLPDIGKQQELFDVHTGKGKNQLERCVYCKQVVRRGDRDEHYTHHSTETA